MADQAPWEKYGAQAPPQAGETGPWAKYAAPAAAPPTPAHPAAQPYQSDLRKIPLIGKFLGSLDENIAEPAINKMATGFERMAGAGAKDPRYTGPPAISESRPSAVMGGISDMARGIAPAIAPAMLGSPIRSAVGLGAGAITQPVMQRASEQMGAGPGTSQFVGDAAGLATGLGAAHRAGQTGAAFKSGINPPPPPAPLPAGVRGAPIWQGNPAPTAPPIPEVDPIYDRLPSGRSAPLYDRPISPPPARTPIWANNPPPTPAAIPPVEPIHQPLPSGRMQWPQEVPMSPRISPPQAPTPTLPPPQPGGVLPRLQALSQKADELGYGRPQAPPPSYAPPKAEVIHAPEAVKPDSRVLAQQLADEMTKSGTLEKPKTGTASEPPKPSLTKPPRMGPIKGRQ